MGNIITHSFTKKTDMEEFVESLKEAELEDLIAIGFKDGHINILHAELSNVLETIAALSIATDYLKELVNGQTS